MDYEPVTNESDYFIRRAKSDRGKQHKILRVLTGARSVPVTGQRAQSAQAAANTHHCFRG